MDRSHIETRFIIENNVRRTNPREEGLWKEDQEQCSWIDY